jgi:hypothetical protein
MIPFPVSGFDSRYAFVAKGPKAKESILIMFSLAVF